MSICKDSKTNEFYNAVSCNNNAEAVIKYKSDRERTKSTIMRSQKDVMEWMNQRRQGLPPTTYKGQDTHNNTSTQNRPK